MLTRALTRGGADALSRAGVSRDSEVAGGTCVWQSAICGRVGCPRHPPALDGAAAAIPISRLGGGGAGGGGITAGAVAEAEVFLPITPSPTQFHVDVEDDEDDTAERDSVSAASEGRGSVSPMPRAGWARPRADRMEPAEWGISPLPQISGGPSVLAAVSSAAPASAPQLPASPFNRIVLSGTALPAPPPPPPPPPPTPPMPLLDEGESDHESEETANLTTMFNSFTSSAATDERGGLSCLLGHHSQGSLEADDHDNFSPLLDLLQRFPVLFGKYVLDQLDPSARVSLARTGSAFQARADTRPRFGST